MSRPIIESIQVGSPKSYTDEDGKIWQSAIGKQPVSGAVRILKTVVEGDHQVDTRHHGGVDKAVLAYSANHFQSWTRSLPVFAGLESLDGAFGENLTISGLEEDEVCLGDIYQVGTAQLQVSQPRQPCWKLSRLWKSPKLAVEVQKTGRTGWYLRVITEGQVEAGDEFSLTERLNAEWTISKANEVMYAKPRNNVDDLRLSECQLLSESWRMQLAARSSAE